MKREGEDKLVVSVSVPLAIRVVQEVGVWLEKKWLERRYRAGLREWRAR